MIDILLFLNHFQKKREENEAYMDEFFCYILATQLFLPIVYLIHSKNNYSDQNNLNRTKNK